MPRLRISDAASAARVHARPGQDGSPAVLAEIRERLRRAEEHLGSAVPPIRDQSHAATVPADPVARRYAGAVDALAAGGDLLHLHVSVNSGGFREPRSDWAEVLASGPVMTALAAEVTMWAHHAERLVSRMIDAPGVSRQLRRPHLASARGHLAVAARSALAGPGNPDTAARAEVLHAVPAPAVPGRIVPDGRENDAELCAGIAVSARRLRAGSFAMSREPGDSAVLSGPAWRRTAHAAAITCDLAVQVMERLARMPESISGVPPRQMTAAASSFAAARGAWRDAAWMWRQATTDTSSQMSWTAADATDIALRLGRLTSGEPGWAPASAKLLTARPAEDLARDARALADVIGAVHEAADAFTRMAGADFAAINAVRRAGRLYMPARLLGGSAMTSRQPYAAVPDDRARLLKNAYYLCFDTSLQAAGALDGLAVRAQAPSRILGLFRSVLPGGPGAPAPEKGFELSERLFADQAGLFTRPPGIPGRPMTRDHAYIISVCTRESLTVEEAARRFSVSPYSVRAVLAAAGIEASDQEAPAGRERSACPEPPSLPPGPGAESPLYHRLRERGIDDPGLL